MKQVEDEIQQAKQKLAAYESKTESLQAANRVAIDEYNVTLEEYRAVARAFEAAESKVNETRMSLKENEILSEFHATNIMQLEDQLTEAANTQTDLDNLGSPSSEQSASATQPMSQGA